VRLTATGDPPRFSSPKLIYAGPLDFVTINSYDITVLQNWPATLDKPRYIRCSPI
jgi:hypothetical protein